MNKNINFIKSLFIFFLSCIFFLSLFELAYFYFNKLDSHTNITCHKYEWILYAYCPEIKHTLQNSNHDGGKQIISYTDKIGGRIRSFNTKEINQWENAKNIFIGDSFIQADEVSYADTFYGIIENDKKSYAIGHSSWNPIQYLDVIKKINTKDTKYHVFLFINDFIKNDNRSVYGEYLEGKTPVYKYYLRPLATYKALANFKYILFKYKQQISEILSTQNEIGINLIDFSKFNINYSSNCNSLSNYYLNKSISLLAFDYLAFSKEKKCWNKEQLESVNMGVNIIKDLVSYVNNSLDSKIDIYLIPAGWSFKNQNSIGRETKTFKFPKEVKITSNGLYKYLKNTLENTNIIDLEDLIQKDIDQCNKTEQCRDQYYFALDGHWTSKTHKLIANYILKNN